jgi:hypothetical protein
MQFPFLAIDMHGVLGRLELLEERKEAAEEKVGELLPCSPTREGREGEGREGRSSRRSVEEEDDDGDVVHEFFAVGNGFDLVDCLASQQRDLLELLFDECCGDLQPISRCFELYVELSQNKN